MNIVGETVSRTRTEDGLSQNELADRIGDITNGAWQPTRDDLYRIESGTRLVSDLEAIAIAAALGREVGWLLSGGQVGVTTAGLALDLFGIRNNTVTEN